jgi:hypothetical protein
MASSRLSRLELQIIEALWVHGPLAVRDVVLKCVIDYATVTLGEAEAANAVEQALKATVATSSVQPKPPAPPTILH